MNTYHHDKIDESFDQDEHTISILGREKLDYNEILNIPYLPLFIGNLCCLKGINYGLLFWLPKYIDDQGLE